ncbi:outer membrane immunogenic protein [Devosia enhydra]|uniref:Outer membrane immunogenic protein n=1 Tax=Devosia enhydra TaxID=665118 RepID=A0A1K2HS15_9HYPH|nr:outer membrane protein [Devosia enhydra]SFZ80603.1 outer membrane immunogenic protein [Devosia enhydra]
MKIYLALAALTVSTSAYAADLSMVSPIYPAPVSTFDWTGPYIGLHAGYGWGDETDDQSGLFPSAPSFPGFPGGPFPGADAFDMSGFVGGIHAGYTHQLPSGIVLGFEGDLDYADISGGAQGIYREGFSLRTLGLTSHWQGSLRARTGYAIDNALLYGTAGVAFADGTLTNSGFNESDPIPSSSETRTHVGWTVGLGAEYAFTQNWIGRAEVRYTEFLQQSYPTFDGNVNAGWSQTTANVGISYRF